MAIPVKLEVFEGPLDFLLHLIDKNKIDIYDIPIVVITQQYLDYIRVMPTQDMNVMSEFMVMAATLIDIKCRMLLPKEVNEEGIEEDPRAELVQRLLEYKMIKYMSMELRDRYVSAQMNLYRSPNLPQEVAEYQAPINYEELLGEMTLSKLHLIFEFVLKKQEDKIDPIRSQYGNVEKEEVDLEARQIHVLTYVQNHRSFRFEDLLNQGRTKMQIIVTFLIVLELMKLGTITIRQEQDDSDIWIESNMVM
ncbi:MAG: segregation/condensation protein A [Clostridium sp.]|jgi:segregation and condensation protein A|nr:segregation/condensation protein A [Clostridium sp.]